MRIGIVGAASLLGKELAEELGNSALAAAEVTLLDEEDAAGQLAAVGDEPALIHRIDVGSFVGLDLVFFAGTRAQTRKHWPLAARVGAGVVDLTFELGGEAGAVVRSPWVAEALGVTERLDLGTAAVIPAHPVAVMLGLAAARSMALGVNAVAATVLVPASERGQAGMDEMHQQTVNLLSFQGLPQEEFDAQVAFNLLPALGAAARVGMEETAGRVVEHYRLLGRLPELAIQMIHAPVFHGYGVSAVVDGSRRMSGKELETALGGEHLEVRSVDEDAPGNVTAAGQQEMLVRVQEGAGRRMWLWMAGDNLKLAVLHAIACALELERVRPQGVVQ